MSQRFTGGGIGSDLPEAFPPAHDDAWAEILEDTTGRHDCDVPKQGEHPAAFSSAQVPNSRPKNTPSKVRSTSSRSNLQAPIVPPGIRPRAPTRSQAVISTEKRDGVKSPSGPVMPSLIKPVFADEESADVALKVPLSWEKSGPRRTPSGSFATVNSETAVESPSRVSSAVHFSAGPGANADQEVRFSNEVSQGTTDALDPRSKPIYSQIETALEHELEDYAVPWNLRLSRFTDRNWGRIKGFVTQMRRRRGSLMDDDFQQDVEQESALGFYKAQVIAGFRARRWVWIGVGGIALTATLAMTLGGRSGDDGEHDTEKAVSEVQASAVVSQTKPPAPESASAVPVVGARIEAPIKDEKKLVDEKALPDAAHTQTALPSDDEGTKPLVVDTENDAEQPELKMDVASQVEVHVADNDTATKASERHVRLDGSRVIPPDTPQAHREALLSIPIDPDDRKPVGAIGLTGIHVDKLSFGREYVDHRCLGETRTFSVTRRDRVNVCIRMIHDSITETADIKWEFNGTVRRRNKVHLSRHRHFVGGYAVLKLAMETQWIGDWRVFVESSDGMVLAEVEFEVIE